MVWYGMVWYGMVWYRPYVYVPAFWGAISQIWYSNRWVFTRDEGGPNYINWVYFEQIVVNKKWMFFFRKWYTDGWVIMQKIGIEEVKYV